MYCAGDHVRGPERAGEGAGAAGPEGGEGAAAHRRVEREVARGRQDPPGAQCSRPQADRPRRGPGQRQAASHW